jgi:hypothetical protein
MTTSSAPLLHTTPGKTVILREAPRNALLSAESLAPTEESLSEAESLFRHVVFPGVARVRQQALTS